MIYMTPHNCNLIALSPNRWGVIVTPAHGGDAIAGGYYWCGDNEIFTGHFEWTRFQAWLKKMLPNRARCLFIVVPDAVGDPHLTRARFNEYAPAIRELGYPLAFVAQDGQESLPYPDDFAALFIGGSTEWKMSAAADECIRWAKQAGKWVHVGRVNSQKRIRHFQIMGVDSVDGTGPAFAPNREARRLGKQLDQMALFNLSKKEQL